MTEFWDELQVRILLGTGVLLYPATFREVERDLEGLDGEVLNHWKVLLFPSHGVRFAFSIEVERGALSVLDMLVGVVTF